MVSTGEVVWQPPGDVHETAQVGRFMSWLARVRGVEVSDYHSLYRWSIADLPGFWSAIWDYFDVIHHDVPTAILAGSSILDAGWFPGATLNFAENMLRHSGPSTAIIARSQTRDRQSLTWDDLRDRVARARRGLRRLGVGQGDRVAGYLPNIPETTIAFLATVSLGGTWSSCPPEFGSRSVIDRFRQIDPTVLLTVDGYRYGDKQIDKLGDVERIREALPELAATVVVPYLTDDPVIEGAITWEELLVQDGELTFQPVPFDHPLAILYSSGTTGPPKAIMHSHGGILLEHLKHLGLSLDVQPSDRFFWYSTTGWVMWNLLTSGLLHGAAIVLFDGNLAHPDLRCLWRLAEEEQITSFGVSAGFLLACRSAGLQPRAENDLSSIRSIGSTGSPLTVEGYDWVYNAVKGDVRLMSGSGGTDVATGFVGGSPLVPVYAGEMSCPALGVDVVALDDQGRPVVGEPGELVVRQPMPSMPIAFWADEDGSRLRETYFEYFPGLWRHGDWITFSPRGSSVISGRSDATLNRGGVRLGTSEFYSVVEELPDIVDSLVVHLEGGETGAGTLILFVAPQEGTSLDDELARHIRRSLQLSLSPRHIPDEIIPVHAVPRTLSGKKLELPVKRVLEGAPPAKVASCGSVANPEALDEYAKIAAHRTRRLRPPMSRDESE